MTDSASYPASYSSVEWEGEARGANGETRMPETSQSEQLRLAFKFETLPEEYFLLFTTQRPLAENSVNVCKKFRSIEFFMTGIIRICIDILVKTVIANQDTTRL